MFNFKKLKTAYAYNDISLVPAYSELKSRSEANPSMHGFYLPIICSCMDVFDYKMMSKLMNSKVPFIAHRSFKTVEEQINTFIWPCERDKVYFELPNKYVWFAVGSVQKYKDWINTLYDKGVRRFCVDMAHGDSKACVDTIKYIKELDKSKKEEAKNNNTKLVSLLGYDDFPVHVIAGNVASLEGFKRLQKAGADGVRVGIASGSICFSPNTKVWYVSNKGKVYQKEIKYIQLNDKVVTGTGKNRKVIKLYKNEYNGEVYKIDDILATPTHKFLVFNKITHEKEYIQIKDIDVNSMSFVSSDGKYINKHIDLEEYHGYVYNIEVDDEHTYCVGNDMLAVSNCSTALETGMGVPILSNIADIAPYKKNTWLIADGGANHIGDIAKAIKFGADFVMTGKMFAATDLAKGECYNSHQESLFKCNLACDESYFSLIYPHELEEKFELAKKLDYEQGNADNKFKNMCIRNVVKYKSYHGMASRDARKDVMSYASVEGRSGLILYDTTTEQFIHDTYLRLQASLSYGGAHNWEEFRKKVGVILRSPSGISAAKTHLDILFDK